MNGSHEATSQLKYSVTIEWSDEDSLYIATVPELPGCRTHGKTYVEAAANADEAMRAWVKGAIIEGETLDEPRKFVFRWWDENGELYNAEDEASEEPLEMTQP